MLAHRTEVKSKVLIVDDHQSSLIAMRAALECLPVEVLECSSGEQALLCLLRESDIAVILLDVGLPGMDGFETATEIRERPSNRDIPILFLTGLSKDEDHVARGYELGAVDYLFKPFVPEFLVAKVRVFCDLHEKTRALEWHAEALMKELEQLRRLAAKDDPANVDMAAQIDRYVQHLETYLETSDGQLAQAVADALFNDRVSGAQLIEVHLAALERISDATDDLQRNQMVQDARLLVLGVMANLVDLYKG